MQKKVTVIIESFGAPVIQSFYKRAQTKKKNLQKLSFGFLSHEISKLKSSHELNKNYIRLFNIYIIIRPQAKIILTTLSIQCETNVKYFCMAKRKFFVKITQNEIIKV